MPVYGTRPWVAFMPTMPQYDAGMRIDPPWSPPMARSTSPAASSAALPDDEPPADGGPAVEADLVYQRIGERELREIHLPAMKEAVKAGATGVMAAYNEIDGVPCHANEWLLKDVLREGLGFDGIVMADGCPLPSSRVE